MVAKVYPPGQITPYGAKQLLEGTSPLIKYTSHDENIEWYLHGGMAPTPGVQEGAVLADGIEGMHPAFSFAEHKGARQHGVTTQRVVYDPAEMDLQVELTVPPNPADPPKAAEAIRRVIRDWMESWDPNRPGELAYITRENGVWKCTPRLYRSPPERALRAQGHRLRQRYTWIIRNDDAFWRGTDSVSQFPDTPITGGTGDSGSVGTGFPNDFPGNLGPGWNQSYSGTGSGELQATNGGATWLGAAGSIAGQASMAGINAQQTIGYSNVPLGVPSGGNFTLGLAGSTSDPIPHNATPGQVQSALELMPTIGSGNVSVSGQPGAYTATFQGAMGNQAVPTMTATSYLTGSDPNVTVATSVPGMPDTAIGGLGATAVTITTGDDVQAPTAGTPGSPGQSWPGWQAGEPLEPAPSIPTVSVFGWWNTDQTNGVGGYLSAGQGLITLILDGVETILAVAANILATIANIVISIVTTIVEIAIGIFQTVVTLIAAGIVLVVGVIAGIIGAFFEALGFGSHSGEDNGNQYNPPPVTGVTAGGPQSLHGGYLTFTNFGSEDGWPRYLCYGPGTFRIQNGPSSGQMIEFGPLLPGQVALLTTLPRLRGVVDMTPGISTPAQDPKFTDFLSQLFSLAFNKNTPPLIQQFQSLFGISPPQGEMYSLLKGRFTNPIPPKPAGQPPAQVSIAVQIEGGGASSKIIGALTPLRRWPE